MTPRLAAVLAALAAVWPIASAPLVAQSHPGLLAIQPLDDLRELQRWDARVDALSRSGALVLRRRIGDPIVSGRTLERYDQMYGDARVVGGDLTRQAAGGLTVSIFGRLYDGITIDPVPTLSPEEARAVIERAAGTRVGAGRQPELVVWPTAAGTYALAYSDRVMAGAALTRYFVDAHDGAVLHGMSELKTQSAVGRATGVLGDVKKISVESMGGRFVAQDLLRPPAILTYDMQGDLERTRAVINETVTLGPADLASDDDNDWQEGGPVDAHVYAGLTYDYYFKRFGRRGLDAQDLPVRSLVNPVRRRDLLSQPSSVIATFYVNAFYAGDGLMVYGVGLPGGFTLGGQTWDFTSGALDVVSHELTHGVTDFTSRLIYQDESGALNESFSDIMATATEFFFQTPGSLPRHADYTIGEDAIRPNGIRSMSNPGIHGDPDHYSQRFTGSADNGGVHTNAGISNHAYYLAIEGGRHRLSGVSVEGVGVANRDQIERIFYRAFTELMPAGATFAVARAATIQAARDLFGSGSSAERAVRQAWTAVGVN